MKLLNLFLLFVCAILACAPSSQKGQQPDRQKIVEIKSLSKEPQSVDFIAMSEVDFNTLVTNIKEKATLDTTTSFGYHQGVLISESPFQKGSYIIHPPKTPFDRGSRMGAALWDNRLVFVGICPDDNPNCPSFPPKGPDLPDTCDDPPCIPDFSIEVDGTFPIPRSACNAFVLPTTWNSACGLRQPCEQEGHSCKPRYRYFQNSFVTQHGEVTKPLKFFFFTCKCECS